MNLNAMRTYCSGTIYRLLSAAALAAFIAACSPNVSQRGNLPDPEVLKQIKPGLQSRDEVADMLGSPSSVAPFGLETWYYISSRTATLAFYKPEVLDRKIVAIAFDDAGKVESIRTYGLDDGRKIEPIARVTPTGGHKLTVLEQLVGNLGRFTGNPRTSNSP